MQGNNLDNPEKNTGQIFDSQDRQNTQENGEALSASESQSRQAIFAGTSKSQKIAVILLAFFAVFIVIMWFISFQNSLKSPFEYSAGQNQTLSNTENNTAQRETQLKTQDTDGDGLSDWDELYIYQTSPYLEDSDSDGYSDKKEIDSGNDPNCPMGIDCYSSELLNENTVIEDDNSGSDILNQISDQAGSSGSGLSEADFEQILGGDIDASSLRTMLLEYGMDEIILNQFSDEQLMESFQEVMSQQAQ